jgi:hypothetical protein
MIVFLRLITLLSFVLAGATLIRPESGVEFLMQRYVEDHSV